MELFLVKNVPKWQNLSKQPIRLTSRISKRENFHLHHNKVEPFIYNKNPKVFKTWKKSETEFLNQNEEFHDEEVINPTKTLIIVPDPVTDEPIQFLRPPPPPNNTNDKKYKLFENKKKKSPKKSPKTAPKKLLRYNSLMDESDWKPMNVNKVEHDFQMNFSPDEPSIFTENENEIGFKVEGNKLKPIKIMEKIPFRYVPF